MRECERAKRLLSLYLDKETNDVDATFVREHLKICHICQKEYSGLSRVKQLMLDKERKSLPADYLVSRLKEQIAGEQYAEERLSWIAEMGNLSRRLIPVPVAVAALSIIFMVITSKQQITKYSLEEQLLSGGETTTEIVLGLIMGTQN